MIVRFNSPDEFLDEMTADAEHVERKILRLTTRRQRSGTLPISTLSVVATCVANGHLVQLDRYVGDLWGHGSPDEKKVIDEANALIKTIQDKAESLGLTVRPGVYEEKVGAA